MVDRYLTTLGIAQDDRTLTLIADDREGRGLSVAGEGVVSRPVNVEADHLLARLDLIPKSVQLDWLTVFLVLDNSLVNMHELIPFLPMNWVGLRPS